MQKTKTHAFINRIHVRLGLIAALVGGFPVVASAGYAQLAPPPGWSPGHYAPSANDASYGRVIHTPNGPTANVGGQAVKMPASYRLAANAPRIAAGVIFANPYLRTGIAIASWLGLGKMVWDAVNQKWVTDDPNAVPSDSFEYFTSTSGYKPSKESLCEFVRSTSQASQPSASVTVSACYVTPAGAPSTGYDAQVWLQVVPQSGSASIVKITAYKRGSACPAGWYTTPAGCVQTPPPKTVTQQEFEDALAPKPMPERVPQELPQPTPLPIEQPSPYINPEPGSNPQHRPRFVPSGDPVPNPNYDPNSPLSPSNQPWVQPGTRIVPSPTASEPWRVDYQPVNRPQATKDPVTNPENEPGTKPSDKEEQPDLCEKYPDILACAKPELDTPEDEIPKAKKEINLQEENLFGSGSCPADVYFTPHGLQQMKVWDWNQSCGYITGYVKPILIICCSFAAFMILIPGRTE